MHLPNQDFLQRTGDVDYYNWNYQFPIKYIQRFRFHAILGLLGNETVNTLLEVGTGSGIFLPELSKHCRELYACDIHNNMDAVETLCKLTGIDATLQRCPLEETGYPDRFFDVIVAVSVLEFVNDLEQSLIELKRILKPDGVFLTICPHQNPLLDFFLSFCSRKKPKEEFGDSRTRVIPSLEKHFKVVQKKTFPLLLGKVLPVYYYYKLQRTD